MKVRARFQEYQLTDLRREGLLPEQIEELEKVLPRIRALSNQLPSLTEVRTHIQKIAKQIDKAALELQRIEYAAFPEEQSGSEPHISRIVRFRGPEERGLAGLDALEAYDALDFSEDGAPSAVTLLEQLRSVLIAADAKIVAKGDKDCAGKVQRRAVAHWEPIEQIDQALFRGWMRHHVPGFPEESATGALPAYEALAVSPSGPFLRIATVCYEAAGVSAAGKDSANPDKAIRRYKAVLERRSEREVAWRKRMNDNLPEGQKYRDQDLEVRRRGRGRRKAV
jgi:hypothetical protein